MFNFNLNFNEKNIQIKKQEIDTNDIFKKICEKFISSIQFDQYVANH